MKTGNLTTVARPYAIAAFEYALTKKALLSWELMLSTGAMIVENENVNRLLNNPKISSDQIYKLFVDVLADQLDSEKQNFIRLLADNHRLAALPAIVELFKSYREAHEKTLTVQVTSAIPLDEAYKRKLAEALTRRLQRQVSLQCDVNADLLGGAIVQADDTVFDGSVRGKLNRLLESL